jgi:hypothetical protein
MQTPDPAWLVPAIVLGFAVVFPLFWCLVVTLIGHVGDWARLARRFPAGPRPGNPAPERPFRHGVSGRIGLASYRHVLSVGTSRDGLHLAVMPLFRCGHRPLFIPWSAVLERHPVRLLLGGRAERLVIGDGTRRLGTILLPAEVLEPAAA